MKHGFVENFCLLFLPEFYNPFNSFKSLLLQVCIKSIKQVLHQDKKFQHIQLEHRFVCHLFLEAVLLYCRVTGSLETTFLSEVLKGVWERIFSSLAIKVLCLFYHFAQLKSIEEVYTKKLLKTQKSFQLSFFLYSHILWVVLPRKGGSN